MTPGYDALRNRAARLDLSSRGRIAVRGRDRARLLHAISTNEVKKLAPGAGCYAFLLTPQGRIQAGLVMLAFEDRFLLDTEPELREKVPQLIRRYIVADQVELEDATGATAAAGVEGPGARAVLEALGAPCPEAVYSHAAWGTATVAALSFTGQPGFRIYCPAGDLAALEARLDAAGAVAATADAARAVRIENGIPRYGEDFGETSLPQETGLMHAISFSKGCYLGQEIVERIRSQGHVNRKLMRLEIEGPAPPPGTRLAAGGTDAGEITSSVDSPAPGKAVALAWVRAPYAEAGRTLAAGQSTAIVSSGRS